MASPFNVFRRHQKAMLAVVGIMAMISFVFLPIIADSVRSISQGGANPVAVTSNFGDLRDGDLYQLRQKHLIVVNFLSRALAEAGPEQASPRWYNYQKQMASIYLSGRTTQEIDAFIQSNWLNQVQSFVERETGQSTERALAENWLLANRAHQLGIVISNEAVIQELRNRVAGLPEEKVLQIIDSTGVGQQRLVEAYRSHLLAQRLRGMFQLSLFSTTPAQRWADYQKLHRQATIEVAVLPVAGFVSKVADPDEKTVGEYFERYKDRAYDPLSSEPGFREPYRATVDYFKAEFEKFVDPKSVTEEEIAKYYEEHKSDYIQRELPKPEETAKPQAKPENPAQKPAEPPQAASLAPKPEATRAKVSAKPEPAQDKPALKTPGKALEKPQDQPVLKMPGKAPEKPVLKAPEKTPEKPKADTKGKSSSLWKSARLSLAALEKEQQKPAPSATPAQARPAAATPAQSKPAAAKPAAAKPADTKPAAKPADTKPAAKPEPPPQYTPLDQVRDQIRDRLARERAAKKMRAVLEPIRDQLRRHSAQLARAKGRDEEPPKFDAAGVAKANGLQVKHLEMVSQRDVAGTDIGGSRTTDQQAFEQHVFRAPGLGRPTVSQDLEGNMYLFWKENESKEHVPKLDDPGVRARVVSAWKTAQAFDLAKAEANRLAEKARKGKAPLKESLKPENAKVLEPKAFSWLTRGQVPMEMDSQTPPQFSRVEGVDAAGDAFMQAVFSMEQGEVAVTTNMPKTEVFVVRVEQFSPSTNVLWELFIHEDYGRYASAAVYNQRAIYESWLDEMKDAAAFQWKRTPDQRDENAEPVGPQEPPQPPQF